MKAMVCRYSKWNASRTYFCIRYVTIVAIVKTNATAAHIPAAVSTFLDTPKNGQMPKNCDNTMLFTKIAVIKINI
jgi:hypothetical protein